MQLDYVVQPDGAVEVLETIEYQFSAERRHGVHREIQVRTDLPGDPPRYRLLPFTLHGVTSPTGASTDVEVSDNAEFKVLRIGSPSSFVQAIKQTYRISYRLERVFNDFPDREEFYYNPVGVGWDVPIDRVTVRVRAPRAATAGRCFQGPEKSTTPCAVKAGQESVFTAASLAPHQGMSVVAFYPRGMVANATPLVRDGRAADGGGLAETIGAAPARAISLSLLALALLVPGGAAAAMSRARARRQRSAAPEVPVGLRMTPPEGVEPALAGVLLSQRARPAYVSATVVDLAVRGHLRLEEVPREGAFRKKASDWRLSLPDQPPPTALRPYEQHLLGGLFRGRGTTIMLSDLRNKFSKVMSAVQNDMYAEVSDRGWFTANPQTIRRGYRWAALAVGLLGLVVCALGFAVGPVIERGVGWSFGVPSIALVGFGLLVAAAIVAVAGAKMVARTATGAQVRADALGFRDFLSTAGSAQVREEEAAATFSRYLPYAITFGVVKEWAQAFERYTSALPRHGAGVWFGSLYLASGPPGGGHGFTGFGASMSDFSSTASGTFTSTPGASGGSGGGSGGFSGGGAGGGGGGGSW